ncbi:hypothetical protein KTQ42_08230|uniref:hypothetical protein n=1 Tax=Noviherbaspirillum sp. L7-7A TaxID=2850560 RepID=UPI001C2B84C5|nr:hypothetical protein [Noviherbaspirillum sp. L7-7A]MBV0879288.1 hypothetical protein [Noviherbaspirillum sp. L7-7A]
MTSRNASFKERVRNRLQYLWRLAIPLWQFRDANRGTIEQRIANYRFNREMRNILPFFMLKWAGIATCLMKMTELLSGLMLTNATQGTDHLCATLLCMGAGIAFAFACIVLLVLTTSYLYLSCVER